MKDFIAVAPIGLVIWWLAQTVLCLRDYFSRRSDVRKMAPPTEEEKEVILRIAAMRPVKEKQSFRWYIENPGAAVKHGWIFVPVLVFFWPMVALLYTLPPVDVRLSPATMQRLKSEEV